MGCIMLKEEKRIGYEREEGWLEIERKERGRDWKDEKRARVEESDKNRQSKEVLQLYNIYPISY